MPHRRIGELLHFRAKIEFHTKEKKREGGEVERSTTSHTINGIVGEGLCALLQRI